MEPNPYQSPDFPELAPAVSVPIERPVVTFDLEEVRAKVRPPAIALLVLSALSLPIDLIILSYSVFNDQQLSVEDPLVIVGIALGFGFVTILRSFSIFGMIEMCRLRSYKNSALAMAVSLIPGGSLSFLFAIPVVIWAYRVLKKPDVQAAFHS